MNDVKAGRLLIIDDEPELREVLVALLEDSVPNIAEAGDGMAAIELLGRESFDAILSDEKMPRKSGLDVLRWLRQNGIQTPFIIHSGFRHKDMAAEATRLGAFAFIDKPWDEKILINTVCDALSAGLAKKT